MPKFGPIKRRDLIKALRAAGFEGPFTGSDHEVMERGDVVIKVPNPHEGDVSRDLLKKILFEAGINRDEWEQL